MGNVEFEFIQDPPTFEVELLTEAEAISVGLTPAAYKGENGKSPYVDEEGFWWEYDDEAQEYKNTGIQSDKGAAQAATEAAALANAAGEAANAAAEKAEEAASNVEQSISDADAAAQAAIEAAGNADAAAQVANNAAQSADQAAQDATAAGEAAKSSAQKADEAAERANQAASGVGLRKLVVETLPEPEQMEDDTIYLVPSKTSAESNVYDEYIKIEGNAELIGSTAVDLSNYVQDEQLTKALADYAQKSELNNYIPKSEADNFATKEDLGDYAKSADLDKYATTESLSDYATKEQLSTYAEKSDLEGYIPVSERETFATKDELEGYIPVTEKPDFATKNDLEGYLPASKEAELATKTDLTNYIPTSKESEFATQTDLQTKADQATVNEALDQKADLLDGKVNPDQLPEHLIIGEDTELPPVELGLDADTLQGHSANYFATATASAAQENDELSDAEINAAWDEVWEVSA